MRGYFFVYKRTLKSGKKVYYYQTYKPDGTLSSGKSTGCRTKSAAIHYCETLLMQGRIWSGTNITFSNYAEHFFDDELSENNIFNQILKSISLILLPKIKNDKKKKILYLMSYFQNVEQIHPFSIHWSRLKYQRSNKNYEMLINICHFIVDGLLLSTDDGNYKIANFIDEERMHALFEKFVLQYY